MGLQGSYTESFYTHDWDNIKYFINKNEHMSHTIWSLSRHSNFTSRSTENFVLKKFRRLKFLLNLPAMIALNKFFIFDDWKEHFKILLVQLLKFSFCKISSQNNYFMQLGSGKKEDHKLVACQIWAKF